MPLREFQAKVRAGLVRVVLEIDLVQRPRGGKMDLRVFSQKALLALFGQLPGGSSLPSLPVMGLSQKGDMVLGFVDLPAARASQLLRASGSVRGVFARPWYWGAASFPYPPGFAADSHRIVWAKIQKFSDVVVATLKGANIPYDGLVCARSRGEVGIRVPHGSDATAMAICLDEQLSARVKNSAPQTFPWY